ncbi:hypothetical protein SAMN06296952_2652 [Oscillospiraceae bacterium]|nr:hypothetical protein SAMN06296952_2652 [Oscillospiraceae bacterium]
MPEIKCPKCGNVFQVDESDYASIARQIRDHEFEDELSRRIREIEEKKEQELQVKLIKQQQAQQDELSRKELALKEAELRISDLKSKSDSQIKELEAKLKAGDTEMKLAVAQAQSKKDEEIAAKNNELIKLQGQLQNKDAEMKLKETSLKESYDQQLKFKDEEIERIKDFKAKQSTKMIGESLEQHCQNEFNSIRMSAFPNAYFEKDNDARTGSKGDFIFREASEDGTEFISIMFEMKNEMETTATKHKNEDFFKELDKDRKEKGCEYAVLVSMLEADNELYNNGIVDVSYRYEKMYVIRPQFFIPMITLLRNAALNSLKYQRELAVVRNQQLDIVNFESNMNDFKDAFGRNYRIASDKFKKAIEEIDKTIDHLIKTKEALLSSDNNLRLANNKAEDLSIKKLTKNAPSVRAMFDDLNKEE